MEEYCQGGDLLAKMEIVPEWSEPQVAAIIKQILIALQYCHKLGIVHRDIKAENIVYESDSPNSTIKIVDFGISLKIHREERLKNIAGSVRKY